MTIKDKFGYLNVHSSLYLTRISDKFKNRKHFQPVDPRIVSCFIPGTILDILVEVGDEVKKGDDLIILDAMKMQNKLRCNTDGRVKFIPVKKGDKVKKGVVLMELEEGYIIPSKIR